MKKIEIHPFSFALGAAVLALAAVVSGAQTAVASRAPTASPATPIMHPISGIPTPQQMMWITEGFPFIVPAGKIFVLTGLGAAQPNMEVRILINNSISTTMTRMNSGPANNSPSTSTAFARFVPVPPGIVAVAGDSVKVDDQSLAYSSGVIFGYLADA